jgi:chemotaxis methyl-accepting protein methylase
VRERQAARPELAPVLAAVAEHGRVDLRGYLPGPVEQGIAARIEATRSEGAAAYAARLREDAAELTRLVEAVCVPVSAFFRDDEVFEALERVVAPTLASGVVGWDVLRAWAAGIATGEEAWSVAVVLARACAAGPEFRVVASDLAPAFVAVARAGRYPAAAFPPRWTEAASALLWRDGDDVVASDHLRARVAFGEHDLLGPAIAPREAVIASFHLVTLRNVLIYLERRAQRRVLERVVSVIEPGGALVLGAVETPAEELRGRLEPFPGVDPRLRIYRVTGGPR